MKMAMTLWEGIMEKMCKRTHILGSKSMAFVPIRTIWNHHHHHHHHHVIQVKALRMNIFWVKALVLNP